MLKDLKIFQKLAISYFLMGALTVIVISLIFYMAFKNALIERTSAQLSSINILKKTRTEEYFKFRKANLGLFSQDPVVRRAATALRDSLLPMREYRDYSSCLLHFKNELRYKSLVLLDTAGKVLYRSDPGDSLSSWFSRSGKAPLVLRDFLKRSSLDFSLLDATPLSKDSQSVILLGMPVRDDHQLLIGLLVVHKNFSEIENILFERTGMGRTGESYLVGEDGYMRSPSRFFPGKAPHTIQVRTRATAEAFGNQEGVRLIHDYRGVEVLSAYRRLDISGLQWAILSEIDYEEALTPVYRIRNYILLTGLMLVCLIVLITLILSRKISGPIVQLKEIIVQLSLGLLPKEVQARSGDEIGEMTLAIDHLIEGLRRTSGFAYEIGNGNFKTSFVPLSHQDILGASLLQMRDKLKLMQKKEAAMMRERSSALLEGQEKERRRLAMELHDGIGQMLTVIRFKISALDGQEQFQKETKALLDDTISEVRRISNNVMPNVLLDFGLESALKTLCSNTSKYTGIQVVFDFIQGTDLNINFESSLSLYRIAQEALNNAVKYAEAAHVSIEIRLEENDIFMEIRDDGKGFDTEEYSRKGKLSNGIKNMMERVRLLQGRFAIHSSPTEGTQIKVQIPLFTEV